MPGGGTKSGDPNIGLVLQVLVALPLVEHLPGVHVVRVVHVPGYPVPPAGLNLPSAGEVDVAQDEFDRPEAADVGHGVGVVLVLDPAVHQLVVSVLLPDDSLVEAGWVEDTAGLQPQILPGKNFLTEKKK